MTKLQKQMALGAGIILLSIWLGSWAFHAVGGYNHWSARAIAATSVFGLMAGLGILIRAFVRTMDDL
jgi:hypothetical protein